MTHYEGVIVFSPDTPVEQIDQTLGKAQELIEKNGGKTESVDKWGNKRTAYPIGKYREGFYVVVQFISDALTVQETEKLFRLNSSVIRHLIVKLDKKALAKRIVPELNKEEVVSHDESKVAGAE
ncbi:MAG: 30S ribosomal protein S6 [bacterium]